MPELDNEDKMLEVLRQGSPDLYAIYDAIKKTDANPDHIIKALYLLADVQRFTRWGKITFLIQDGKVTRVQQEQGFKLD